MSSAADSSDRLEKRLGLVDVYAIATGAMISSGFFLLPGIAAGRAGPAVVLAYILSSLLMLPGLFSIAELSSAMPRAAGTYFFIHRSLGPWAGTVGGFGDWLTLTFKSAFALVGMGAYLAIFVDVPIQPVAIALTVAFGALNIFGAKETARLQLVLVVTLVTIMAFYIGQGLVEVVGEGAVATVSGAFTPFLPFGIGALASTIGLVFISYAGLTKVAAAAEEIRDLDRNLPLGMLLALGTIAFIYAGGVFVMVSVLPAEELYEDLTPVATAGEEILSWLPGQTGLILVVIAAIAAFASTGNAGILTASRYPLAMARDRLTWSGFDQVGRFGTPTVGILATCVLMIISILFLDVEALASLGSAFLLLIFALVNMSVIIMRESRTASYAPAFRSPFYPWTQIIGVISTLGLIATLGPFSIVFVLVVVGIATAWYRIYARPRVENRGAIYTLFARLGERQDAGIDEELWSILQERGASEEDSFDELVARAQVIDLPGKADMTEVIGKVAGVMRSQLQRGMQDLDEAITASGVRAVVPENASAVVHDLFLEDLEHPEVVLVRAKRGVRIGGGRRFPGSSGEPEADENGNGARVHALVFLFSPEGRVTQHLRLLAQLVTMVEHEAFPEVWRRAHDDQELLETLLRDERYASIVVGSPGPPSKMVDKRLYELTFPGNTLVAMVRRGDRTIFPKGDTLLRAGDRLTVIGSPADVVTLQGDASRHATGGGSGDVSGGGSRDAAGDGAAGTEEA
ncbi:MAG: amino acid permease [Nitriliruptor sp.]|nr:MAG: amino acid permease [Nitriliruptor sp.]